MDVHVVRMWHLSGERRLLRPRCLHIYSGPLTNWQALTRLPTCWALEHRRGGKRCRRRQHVDASSRVGMCATPLPVRPQRSGRQRQRRAQVKDSTPAAIARARTPPKRHTVNVVRGWERVLLDSPLAANGLAQGGGGILTQAGSARPPH